MEDKTSVKKLLELWYEVDQNFVPKNDETKVKAEVIFSSIKQEISDLEKELEHYRFILDFMRSYNLTPDEMTNILKAAKTKKDGEADEQ